MAISVKDIKEKDFSSQKHGYSIEEVDDFLDEIADQVSELIRENLALKNSLQQAQNTPAPEPVVIEKETAKPEFDDQGYFRNLENAMRESLINAQRIAEETRQAAEKEAADTVSAAQAQAAAITADAANEVANAKAEAQSVRDAVARYRAEFRALVEEQVKVLKAKESLFD
ncbi:MAG: DivIVA domain-containing protein [Clostridiales bacterium]|nr:DivIVA domain-containing protein [Clostridiales bacterium]MDD6932864.1 DivIVA domain-containing protein [Eubacteriales bacterium]